MHEKSIFTDLKRWAIRFGSLPLLGNRSEQWDHAILVFQKKHANINRDSQIPRVTRLVVKS